AQADAGNCDLVVKGNLAGEARGAVYVGGTNFQFDRHSDTPLTTTAVRNLAATAGQELTFTCVPPGSGERIGVAPDLDGVSDRREPDCGPDPTEPQSFPPTPPGACSVSTTTNPPPTTTTTSTLASTSTTTSTTSTTHPTTTVGPPSTTTSTTSTSTTTT